MAANQASMAPERSWLELCCVTRCSPAWPSAAETQHAGARPRAPRDMPMPLPRLRLTRESPLEEDSLRLLGKACALLPQFILGKFCAAKPPPAHSKDRVESFSVICRPLHKSQGFRSHERPKLAPKSILKFEYTVLNLSIDQPNRQS